jgi:dolichol-phosphate mannosyltransferase
MQKKEVRRIKLLSIVIPCFNEEEVIETSFLKIKQTIKKMDIRVEYIFIDDGSTDNTRNILKKLSLINNEIKIICFSRNFGHQIAVSAGIEKSKGNALVLIDADLQDPPELIQSMIFEWKAGYDVVYGIRTARKSESYFKKTSSKLFYRVLNYLSDISIPNDSGDFRLIDLKVINAIKNMPEHDRFIRGMISWVGFKQKGIYFERDARFAGETKYPLVKMISFALTGIISFSTKPLKLATLIGFILSILAILGIIYVIFLRFFTDSWVNGWSAIMVSILLIGGIQLICLGLLGEYISRIFNEVKKRPLYVIDEFIDNDH